MPDRLGLAAGCLGRGPAGAHNGYYANRFTGPGAGQEKPERIRLDGGAGGEKTRWGPPAGGLFCNNTIAGPGVTKIFWNFLRLAWPPAERAVPLPGEACGLMTLARLLLARIERGGLSAPADNFIRGRIKRRIKRINCQKFDG